METANQSGLAGNAKDQRLSPTTIALPNSNYRGLPFQFGSSMAEQPQFR